MAIFQHFVRMDSVTRIEGKLDPIDVLQIGTVIGLDNFYLFWIIVKIVFFK